MKRSTMTAAEKKWVARLQAVINECPSKRIQAYTIGDNGINLYDGSKDKQMQAYMDASYGRADHCGAVQEFKADLVSVNFPFPIHSTAG